MANIEEYSKPIPVPDAAFQPFFEGAREHKLMLQHCQTCGTATWPAQSRCPTCLQGELAWFQASGQGVLYSFVLMHQVFHPGFASEVPYNIAEVDLAEGVRMISNIVGCANADLRIGMPLVVTFEDINDEISLPKFKPAE